MHLMLCPDKDCTQILIENVNELTKWMSWDNRTDPEILYWTTKYILMWGYKSLLKMRFMSPQFKALAKSQDLIGWRDLLKVTYPYNLMQSSHFPLQCQAVI
jgi:hypothetical protein